MTGCLIRGRRHRAIPHEPSRCAIATKKEGKKGRKKGGNLFLVFAGRFSIDRRRGVYIFPLMSIVSQRRVKRTPAWEKNKAPPYSAIVGQSKGDAVAGRGSKQQRYSTAFLTMKGR